MGFCYLSLIVYKYFLIKAKKEIREEEEEEEVRLEENIEIILLYKLKLLLLIAIDILAIYSCYIRYRHLRQARLKI
jgi:hypothetical protein